MDKTVQLEVVDFCWNPGENLLLAQYENGIMAMFSTETCSMVMIFEK